MLTFGSLFAGIGGFDLGFHRAGMRCAWQVEIDQSCRAVLARHWPDVPKHEDIRNCGSATLPPVDIICGGFPCQDLSVAGNRAGLSGARSGLFYEMTRIVNELRPAFLIWENVPGLLSSDSGRDFGRVLMELERIGYSGCWSTLDAQFFGVAQRRQRVFGVFARSDIGATHCAEILSFTARMQGDTPKSGAKRTGVATAIAASAGHHGWSSPRGDGNDNLIPFDTTQITSKSNYSTPKAGAPCHPLSAKAHAPAIAQSNRGYAGEVAETVRADSHGALPMVFGGASSERGVAAALTAHAGRYDFDSENLVCGAQSAAHGGPDDNSAQAGHVVAVIKGAANGRAPENGPQYGEVLEDGTCYTLNCTEVHAVLPSVGTTLGKDSYSPTKSSSGQMVDFCVPQPFGVRRLTPLECERLQGFPDGWTEGQSDSVRYRQLGNAVAASVAAWIGKRIVEITSTLEH